VLNLSLLWLLCLIGVMIAFVVWLFSRSDYSTWETILYAPVYIVGRLLWRVSFTNDAPPELKEGAILAANHRSSVDPFFVQLAAKRRVHWLVAKEYCQHFVFGKILKLFEVIPTNRSGLDLNATKLAMEVARQGRLVGMFPEGRINLTFAPLLPIRAGAAMVAVKTEVPVIPIYIEGSPYRRTVWSPLLMPARVRITFGKPIFAIVEPSCANDEVKSDSTQQQSQKLIEQWGLQVIAMSGYRGTFDLALGSATRRRNLARSKETSETMASSCDT
jgi:1-acyl-sn-glycerol-3-phosphate acyltransferase